METHCLHFYINIPMVASYRDVSNRFGIALSTLRKVLTKWLTSLVSYLTPIELPDVIGMIDLSNIRIDKPSEDPDSYKKEKD